MKNNISIVVTGRNDGYDGNFGQRLITALSRNTRSLPDADFIFVEWNPYLDRPLLSDKIRRLFGGRVRCYIVHPKYHDRYCTIDGFLEYPAKNVGVRHAKGDYVLSTNSDVIFSPEVVEKMSNSSLKKDVVYRASRMDIQPEYLNVTFPVPPDKILDVNGGLYNASGDFVFMHKDLWFRSTGYCEEFPNQRIHKDSFFMYLMVEIEGYLWEDLGTITHWRHPSSWSSLSIKRPKVGDVYWDFKRSGFLRNKETWGLSFARERDRKGIIWLE